jgi:hypothetical protein
MPRRATILLALCGTLLATSACNELSVPWGDENSIIAVTSNEFWTEIQDTVYAVLEPTALTVREEKMFTVTQVDPADSVWLNLRRFRQELAIGTEESSWVARALERLDEDVVLAPPQVLQVENVWARDQTVTIMLLSDGGDHVEEVASLLPEVAELYDEQYRLHVLERMYLTGPDTALADTLRREYGFTLQLPVVYLWTRQDSVFRFRNDNPDPSELIREVVVTWRHPIPEGFQPDSLLAWRTEMADSFYAYPQIVDLELAEGVRFEFQGLDAYEIQASWSNPPESTWPAGGPFILRGIICPAQDRLYMVDGWLYAPGKEKYQYMLQLETILDSFRCGV